MLLWTLFAAAGATVVLLRQRRKRTRGAWRYVPMSLYVGVPGSGKSYRLTWGLLRALAQGRHVRANFLLRPHRVYTALRVRYGLDHDAALAAVGRIGYVRSWDDLIDAVETDVFLDEAQDLLNAHDWAIFPQPVVTWFAQHRHRRVTITLASHRFSSIHAYLRDGLIARIYLTRPASWVSAAWYRFVLGEPHPLLQFVQIKDEEEEVLKSSHQRRGFLRGFFTGNTAPLDPVVANCYDHEGGVLPSPLAELRRAKGKDLGLELVERAHRPEASEPVDGLPHLEPHELLDGLRRPRTARPALADRWPTLRPSPRPL